MKDHGLGVTTLTEMLDILHDELDGNGLVITDRDALREAVYRAFPDLKDDTLERFLAEDPNR
jgi:hypothetical protein